MGNKEIFVCDIVVVKNKRDITIKNIVWVDGNTHYKGIEIKKVTKKDSLGFQAFNSGFTQLKKSDVIRNDMTGAYE